MQPIIIQSLSERENAVILVLLYTYHLVDNMRLGFELVLKIRRCTTQKIRFEGKELGPWLESEQVGRAAGSKLSGAPLLSLSVLC